MTSMRQTSVPINVYERTTDIEAGRGPPYVHPPATSNVASCEGSSSRVTPPSSQPPMMAPSPHSRFIDGFRRRTRLRSCNVPATGQESLDMDLGFPPVCSPPPDVGPVSTPDTFGGPRLRRRTVSDAAHTGINFVLNNKRHSGVLVIFPHSPSSHSELLHSTPTPTLAASKRPSGFLAGTGASKSFEGSLPATPRSGENGGQSSPRRPLYVDTQLANGMSEKRRSPVTSVVDFVRGRSRAASLSLSGPATPPSPPAPMSVSARASASTDGGMPTCEWKSRCKHQTFPNTMAAQQPEAPMFSPQPRNNGRPPLSRLYRPGMRSLDSGLDLSSPTIGHTALLIKETRKGKFHENDNNIVSISVAVKGSW
ncbi:hypothetical protein RB195_009710 [Necator americanus]|uniref:Uncharacterized protein n=1 Tax=Necator americanus TaxID=51031 RepID=A0ABR1CUL6_NECAM